MPTKILVADDSATMRRVLEMTFAGEDATVHTVEGAEAALAKATELSPDVVFADASLTGVDGYELARRIKQNPQTAKIAVIVLASQQAPYDEAKGRSAGVDDHVSKPFDTQGLIDRVGQVLARTRAVPGSAEATAAPKVAAAPAARPAPPIAAQAAAGASAGGANRMPQGGTRMGMGAPPPAQPAAQPVAVAKPAAPAMPALRPNAPPLAPVPVAQKQAAAPAAAPAAARPAPAPAAAPSSAVAVATQDLGAKLAHLGLTREQLEGVLALSREVIEQVVWEVVPDLAEQLIKEELKRLTAD